MPWDLFATMKWTPSLYWVSFLRKVIRSFLSLAFFRPPKAILVPGMYFFGFSRYANYGFG
jgi:hypothetical protein